MSKAILVMDMPNACEFCPMFIYEKCFCQKLDEYLGNDEADLTIERSPKCPLKEMPNKIDTQRQNEIDMSNGDFLADKICESIGEERQGNSTDIYLGWNACLNKITGDDDEQN